MKPTLVPALVLALWMPLVGSGQTSPSTNDATRAGVEMPPAPVPFGDGTVGDSGSVGTLPTTVPTAVETGSAPVSVPLVRVPTGPGVLATGAVGTIPTDRTEEGVGVAAGSGLTTADMQLGWSSTGVGLREPSVSTVRTNRGWTIEGIVPKAARSERRGFGGFLTGFANMFNPFAPVSKGVESRSEHWYDGGVQSAPLPRGMRDERFHEPKTAIISTDFGRGGSPDTLPPEPAKGTVPEKP
ncbi:MAG: hypothetical protein AB7O66_17850 [Limisphaerales bacterium]